MGTGSDAIRTTEAIRTLNELLRILCRSLPAYLAHARPWASPTEGQQLRAALDRFVTDQQHYARQVTNAIIALGGRPEPGRFPNQFMAKNDLAIEFLQREVIRQQEQDILVVERCATRLEDIASLHSVAEEILGNQRGHLDILKEMMKDEC
jgi:bacterioferritin (cytochrome b1)